MANDTKTIQKAIRLLKERGCTNLGDENSVDEYCWHDLSGLTSNGTPFCAEVKNKAINHDEYGDVMMDKRKEQEFNKQDYFKTFLVFNFYKDGYLGVANTRERKKKYERIRVPKTTQFGNKGQEFQDMVLYKRFNLFRWSTKEKRYVLVKKDWEKNKSKSEPNEVQFVSLYDYCHGNRTRKMNA